MKKVISFLLILILLLAIICSAGWAIAEDDTFLNAALTDGSPDCYILADEEYAKKEQTEEVLEFRKKLFIESRVLYCALQERDLLYYPESMKMIEALYFTNEEQPRILLHFRAKSKGGMMNHYYQICYWNEEKNKYINGRLLNTLETDDTEPYWLESASYEERMDYYDEQIHIGQINIDLMTIPSKLLNDDQIERINLGIMNNLKGVVNIIPLN